MDHIVKSTLPIALVLNNKTFIKSKFGTIDRALLSYGELVGKYRDALKNGGKAMGQFIPDYVGWAKKIELKNQLVEIVENISTYLDLYTEDELKALILPHPYVGRIDYSGNAVFYNISCSASFRE